MILMLFLQLGCSQKADPTQDIIILSIDTLRFDHVSAFSEHSLAQTPYIDSLARDGILYTQTYSPISVTGPAFVSLMTSLPIAEHLVSMNTYQGGAMLEEKEETLAEVCKESHYRTGAFVSGFTLRPSLGLTQGFDVYDYPADTNNRRWGDDTAKKAISWLNQSHQSAFLWYHTYDAHGPWLPRDTTCFRHLSHNEEREGSKRIPAYQRIDSCIDVDVYKKRYAKAVEFADTNVGMIIESLKKQGRYDNALIVITADHGESFHERELWFDHGTTAHEEQLHVPLIIKYPQNKGAGTRDTRLVSLLDIAPTITSVVDMSPLSKAKGFSLVGHTNPLHEVLYGESSHCKAYDFLSCRPQGPMGKVFSMRTREFTIVQTGDILQQYNRLEDPMELHPLAIESNKSTALESFSTKRLAQSQNIVWPIKKEIQQELQQLKQLGYIAE